MSKSSLYKHFETSKSLTTTGAAFTLPKNDDGTVPTLQIARAHTSNQLHAKAVAKVYTPEVMQTLEQLSEDEALSMEIEVFVTGCLMGWKNVLDRDGEVLEFNQANARELLFDLPELFQSVRAYSHRLSNYLKTAEEKAIKN
jgi:hypothetical protein